MPVYWKIKESDQATADNKGELTTSGADTSTAPMRVPAGASRITRVITAVANSVTFAADGSGFLVRLEGDGLPDGPEVLSAGSHGQGTTANNNGSWPAFDHKVDFKVTPGNVIQFFGEMDADLGTIVTAVCVKFE